MEKIKEGQKETKRGKKKWLILLLLLVALGSCMAWSLTREDGLSLALIRIEEESVLSRQ